MLGFASLFYKCLFSGTIVLIILLSSILSQYVVVLIADKPGNSRYEYDARFPPGTEPDVIDLFRRADVDGSGAIDTLELQRILSLKFFNFSRKTVRLMLHLFADDTTSSSK